MVRREKGSSKSLAAAPNQEEENDHHSEHQDVMPRAVIRKEFPW